MNGLAVGQLNGQPLAAAQTSPLEYIASSRRHHALAEAMCAQALAYFGLPGSFGHGEGVAEWAEGPSTRPLFPNRQTESIGPYTTSVKSKRPQDGALRSGAVALRGPIYIPAPVLDWLPTALSTGERGQIGRRSRARGWRTARNHQPDAASHSYGFIEWGVVGRPGTFRGSSGLRAGPAALASRRGGGALG